MNAATMLGLLFAIDVLITVGDTLAKRASVHDDPFLQCGAFVVWSVACLLWFPLMKARGFTRLIALADVMGLVMLAVSGYFFLGERLTLRDGAGVSLACVSLFLLGGK